MVPSMLASGRGLGPLLALKEMTQTELVTPSSRVHGCRSAVTQQCPTPGHPPPWDPCLPKQLVG